MKNSHGHLFPIRAQAHVIQRASLTILLDQLPPSWIVRTGGPDYGLDGEIEIVWKDGLVKGDMFGFQIKGHRKVRATEEHIVERVKVSSVNYWLEVPLPVILFVVDTSQSVVYWIDVKSYVRDSLSIVRPNWRDQKTTQIRIPMENRLPDSLQGIEELMVLHKERLRSYQAALEELEEETIRSDFMGYHILIHVFDGDIDAWEAYLRHQARDEQLISDFPFVAWLKDQLKQDEDLINRIRAMVEVTTPEVFSGLKEGLERLDRQVISTNLDSASDSAANT